MRDKLGKFGPLGAIVAAAACPICFPKLALLGAIFGLGVLAPFETSFFIATQVLVVLAAIGHILAYRKHRHRGILWLSQSAMLLFFVSLYLLRSEYVTYAGFAALLGASVWLLLLKRRIPNCESCVTTEPQQD